MTHVVVIPARLESSRLPRKVLADLAGRPVIQHVYARAAESAAEAVYVATDSAEVASVVEGFGGVAVMTSAAHASGTDRIAEAVARLALAPETIVVNVQGDEPELPAQLIDALSDALTADADAGMATLSRPVADWATFVDPNVVKVVTDARAHALYFSRAPIPWPRDAAGAAAKSGVVEGGIFGQRHIGIYAYRQSVLAGYADLPPSPLERTECLEQLRALAAGIRIRVLEAGVDVPPGIDTEVDLARARERFAAD